MSHLQNQSYLDRRQKASLIFGFDDKQPPCGKTRPWGGLSLRAGHKTIPPIRRGI
jgi:hypothetical protein